MRQKKVQKIKKLLNTGEYDGDLAKYIPGMLEFAFQGITENTDTKEKVAQIDVEMDLENLEFQIMLTNNYYTNPNSMHICYSMKIKKVTNESSDIDIDLIPADIFFAHKDADSAC